MAKQCDNCGACCRRLIVEVYDLDVLRQQHLATADIGGTARDQTYETLMAELEQDLNAGQKVQRLSVRKCSARG